MNAKKKLRWAVVLTTAPREIPSLTESIASIRACGWEPVVFAEPGSPTCDAETHASPTRLGVWRNWLRAVDHALSLDDVDAILTVQDDVDFHPDSREFTESILWPDALTGYLSLYTPRHYSFRDAKEKQIHPPGIREVFDDSIWGAMAFVWHPRILRRIRHCSLATDWIGDRRKLKRSELIERKRNPASIRNVDTFCGFAVRRFGLKTMYADPSPVQHIAKVSSIGNRPAEGKRCAYRLADRSLPLASQIPTGKRFEIAV